MKNKLHDRRFIVEAALFVLLLYGVSVSVYLNGDDFMYADFAHTGILENVADRKRTILDQYSGQCVAMV